MSKHAFDKLRTLLKRYKGTADERFNAEFKSTIETGIQAGQISPEQLAALERVHTTVDLWHRGDTAATNAIDTWLEVVEETKRELPMELLAAAVSHVPSMQLKSVNWSSVVLDRTDRALLRILSEQKILKTSALLAVAKAEPDRFYASAGLDVLLEYRGVPPRDIWAYMEENPERGEGLQSGPEALAEAFSLDPSSDASLKLTELLARSPKSRTAVLVQVLRDPGAVEKLARYLSLPGYGLKGKKRTRAVDESSPIISDFVDICVQAVESGKRTSRVAAWALSTIAVGAFSPVTPLPPPVAKTVEDGLGRIVGTRLRTVLQHAEGEARQDRELLVVTDAQAQDGIQGYLETLPVGGGDDVPAERSVHYQRYRGRKEVIQEILPLLTEADTPDIPRSALDAALFNMGVRPLGVSEGTDTFDIHRHEPIAPGIIPGDAVKVVRLGWQLGDGEDAVILERARVVHQE